MRSVKWIYMCKLFSDNSLKLSKAKISYHGMLRSTVVALRNVNYWRVVQELFDTWTSRSDHLQNLSTGDYMSTHIHNMYPSPSGRQVQLTDAIHKVSTVRLLPAECWNLSKADITIEWSCIMHLELIIELSTYNIWCRQLDTHLTWE